MVIQIDHSMILNITKQLSITSISSTIQINVRLIRASQFLRQFHLDVKYKLGKEYIIPDALLCLPSINYNVVSTKLNNYSKLDVLFTATLIEINPEFRDYLIKGYQDDLWWYKIIKLINNNNSYNNSAATLPFIYRDKLVATNANLYFSPQLKDTSKLEVPIE